MGQTLWQFPWGQTTMQTGQSEVAEHSTHCPLRPRLPVRHLFPQSSALVPKPSLLLTTRPRPLPKARQRTEAWPANDSQMLLNSCKNTVHKWTTWHLGLLVFLPVKRSPQESALSSFTDRNAPWKIIHKHTRLAIQCRAVFPHNFV